jgi:hypothetical protein
MDFTSPLRASRLRYNSGTATTSPPPKSKAEERANVQSIASTARTLKELFCI